MHSNNRPFKCNYYELSSKNLNKHMLKHDGIKKYQCRICNKEFQWYNSLEYYMTSHSGDKPFGY